MAILSEIATSSEAPTIPNLDPNPVCTDTFGNNINSNNSSSNIASPSLNDGCSELEHGYEPTLFLQQQSSTLWKSRFSITEVFCDAYLPYNFAPYEYQSYTQSSSSSYSPLTASNTTQQGEVDGADKGNAGAATTLQQLSDYTLVVPLSVSDSSPPDTTITSAIDSSTGLDTQDGGSISLSNSIIFAFRATDDLDLAGYVCSINGLPVFACSSPVIIDRNILQGTGIKFLSSLFLLLKAPAYLSGLYF